MRIVTPTTFAPRRCNASLGYALQLTTVRFLGTFLEEAAVPGAVLHSLTSQLGIARRRGLRARLPRERTTLAGARPRFAPATATVNLPTAACSSGLGIGYALCWTGTDRPSTLF